MEILTDMKSSRSILVVPGIWCVETAQKRKLPSFDKDSFDKRVKCGTKLFIANVFEMLGPKWVRFLVSRKVRIRINV